MKLYLLVLFLIFVSCGKKSSKHIPQIDSSAVKKTGCIGAVASLRENLTRESKRESRSLSEATYRSLDLVMICDVNDQIPEPIRTKLLKGLAGFKKIKPPVFVLGKDSGLRELEAYEFMATPYWNESLKSILVRLNQLNTGVVAFVRSDGGKGFTHYNLQADLTNPILAPWNRTSWQVFTKKDRDLYQSFKKQKKIWRDPKANFSATYAMAEVSKVALEDDGKKCFWEISAKKIVCEWEILSTITHEISHLIKSRYPHFLRLFLNAKGGFNERMKKAGALVPGFGVNKCTKDALEDHCSKGQLTNWQTKLIAYRLNIPQDRGFNAGMYIAQPVRDKRSCLGTRSLIYDSKTYCIKDDYESLYSLIRKGNEYLPVIMEMVLTNSKQIKSLLSEEENKYLSTLRTFLY